MKLVLAGNTLTLNQSVIYNDPIEIEGTLILDPSKDVTISTNSNIVVTGKLISKPNIGITHIIRFPVVNENNFVGGGDVVLDSDIGAWIMGAGQLDLQGIANVDWKQLGTDATALTTFAASANSNMRIEGTATGMAHLFIKSSQPQFIRGVTFSYMGPRKDINGDGIKELVTGRYACHFHHSEDGSRGSIIEGCIARNCNNHSFVPHGSHGITMRNNIVYSVTEAPFWYDYGHRTNDLLWENNLVVNVNYVQGSQDQDSGGAPTFGVAGFVLGFGDGNICRGNMVIGTTGDPRVAAGYFWPEIRNDDDVSLQLESQWIFENNTVINCPTGEGAWQNNNFHHVNRNSIIIGCQNPLFHGAYQNDYCRSGGMYKGGLVDLRAASATTNRIRFEGVTFDAGGGDYCMILNEGPLDGAAPILIRNCKFLNFKKAAILDQNPGPGLKSLDIIDCGLTPSQIIVTATKTGETVRLQEGDKAWKITKSGITSISKFAPSSWGVGTGLLAQYYATDFKTLLLSRIEPNINLFDITHPSPHYAVPATFNARWTGKIQPQYSESYKFICMAGGGVRLWVNNIILIDIWVERYPSEITSKTIALVANQFYDLKLEFFNSDDRSGCTLEWSSNSLKREFIPMSQLYPASVTPPPPPDNKPPTANAGVDQTIAVTTMLYGTGVDPEGGVITYKWEQTAGTPAVIESPAAATTKVSQLKPGNNIFKLTVTDDKGASVSDEVVVTVN